MRQLTNNELTDVLGAGWREAVGGYVAEKLADFAIDRAIDSMREEHERQKESFKNDYDSFKERFSFHGDL